MIMKNTWFGLMHTFTFLIDAQYNSLVTVDGVGVLVMGLLVTVHAVVGIVAVTVTAEKEVT